MNAITLQQEIVRVSLVEENHAQVNITPQRSIVAQIGATKGPEGKDGRGVPVGGTIGQKLAKKTTADYDTEWVTDDLPVGNDKEIQYNDGGATGADPNLKWDKNTKTLRIGIEDDVPLPNNPLAAVGSVDDYLQVAVKNTREGTSASSDFVATADNGDDSSKYIDMGINSSVYDAEDDPTKANDAYVWANGGDLHMVAEDDGAEIPFHVGKDGVLVSPLQVTASGLEINPGFGITNRPEILYGQGDAPDPTGLAEGTLYYKYLAD